MDLSSPPGDFFVLHDIYNKENNLLLSVIHVRASAKRIRYKHKPTIVSKGVDALKTLAVFFFLYGTPSKIIHRKRSRIQT
jgi:hypothetical protein